MNTTITAPARAPRKARRDILEFTVGGAKHKIDRDAGVIHDVKIIGSRSRNGGLYPSKTLAAAKSLYEGARVNIDHPERSRPDQERTFGDWFGVLENVRHAGDGLYGDLSYLLTHPLASQICEAAERFPASFGLSHNAQVTEAESEGQKVYEKIHHVRSVDIVCKPATTRGIFESQAAADDGVDVEGADADRNVSDRDWNGLTRRLLALYVDNDRPANRMRNAAELFGEILAAESAIASAAAMQPATNRQLPPDLADDGDNGDKFGKGGADETLESVVGRTRDSVATAAPVERRSAFDRARQALEGVGLTPEHSRVAALASLTQDGDRRALVNGWLASVLAGCAAEANVRPRSSGVAIESTVAKPSAAVADNWADPKLATLALLGR